MSNFPVETSIILSEMLGFERKKQVKSFCGLAFLINGNENFSQLVREIESEVHYEHFSLRIGHTKVKETQNTIIHQIELEKKYNNLEIEPLKGVFIAVEDLDKRILYVFCNEKIRFIKRGINVFMLRCLYPSLSKVYLTSKDIRKVLEFVTRGKYFKEILCDRSSGKQMLKEKPTSIVSFESKAIPYERVFQIAAAQNSWVQWIRLRGEEHNNRKISFSISRDGEFAFRSAGIAWAVDILEVSASIGRGYSDFFKDREIKPNREPMPIAITYDDEIFGDIENRERLAEVISKYEISSFAIIHNGNPHVYFFVSDRLDNSSFSIQNIGNSRIMITPLYRSSPSALYRLVDFLVENFREYDMISELEEAVA